MSAFYDIFRAAFPWLAIGLLLAIYFGLSARKTDEEKQRENYGTVGMCIGMCLGVSLKGVLGSVGTGIAIGMLAGVVTMVQDRANGSRRDFDVSPVRKPIINLGYFQLWKWIAEDSELSSRNLWSIPD